MESYQVIFPSLVTVTEELWGVEALLHAFLISALDGDEWSASHPSQFTTGERDASTDWIGG
jgi:hypothetical protein